MKILFFIFLISPGVFSAEQSDDTSCRYRNLMEDNWLRLRNKVREVKRYIDMPAYDQGGTGTCYAFAAVQLIDYWRQSRGFMPDERIALSSPIYMALVNKIAMKQPGSLNTGYIYNAVSSLKNYGLCSQKVVNADLKEFLKTEIGGFKTTGVNSGVQIGEDLAFTELTQGFLFQKNNNEGSNLSNPKPANFQDYLRWSRSLDRPFYIRNLDEMTLKKVYNAFKPYFMEGNYLGFLENVLKSCKEKKYQIPYLEQMPMPRFFEVESFEMAIRSQKVKDQKDFFRWRKNRYQDMIKTLLNRQNAPAVGIFYCGFVLANPGALGIDTKGNPYPICKGGHISILVGKRELGGKCQYLLKNTWNEPKVCEIQKGCIYREVHDPKTNAVYQEEVGVWVDEEDILNNLKGLTYIYPEAKDEKEIENRWRRIEEKYIQSGEAFKSSLQKIRKKQN